MKPTLRYHGDPVLRGTATEITDIDSEIRALASEMTRIMHRQKGIGIAAPQVGEGKRMIVLDLASAGVRDFVLINPTVESVSEKLASAPEGCLSIPGLTEAVLRPRSVVVAGQNLDGEPVKLDATDLLARLLQHEIDHLDGVLFIDRLPDTRQVQRRVERHLKKLARKST